MKKLLYVILTVLIIISTFVSCDLTKFKEKNIVYSQGLVFELSEDQKSYIFVGLGECKDDEIIIPPTYNGLPVTHIGDYAFSGDELIKRVIIPNSVISIGSWAFSSCKSLESIEIPNSVLTVGIWAFAGCVSLKQIVIPNSITSIEPRLFFGCSLLESVYIPNSVTSIGGFSFAGCSALKSVIISDCVTVIETSAFMGCNILTIYCEAESQPSGWNSSWNYSDRPVVWGYKGE